LLIITSIASEDDNFAELINQTSFTTFNTMTCFSGTQVIDEIQFLSTSLAATD